jgi:hypothetical protein
VAKIFYPTAERLKFLLDNIHNRELALPDFQRDFVWDPSATELLLESICQNYPAGSILRIKNQPGFYFTPREFATAPALDGHQPSYLILDGQQRLTSLYHALFGTGSYRYFINLRGLLDGQDLEDCVFHLRRGDAEKQYRSIEKQAESLTFPFALLFRDGSSFERWLDEVLDLRPESISDKKTLKEQIRKVADKWLQTVQNYEFPMVTLSEDTSAAAVCTIFETLNRTGVKLSVYDLLVARFWPQNLRLRDLWDDAKTKHPIIEEFEIDPYYVLQSISLFTALGAPSCKRQDVLKMEVAQIRNGWTPVVQGLSRMLNILRDECGVVLPNWLPYYTILIPAAATLAKAEGKTGPSVGAVRNKLKQWFWCSVFSQAYENAPNSQAAKDYTELNNWIMGGSPPEVVSSFAFDRKTLRQTTPRQRAIYRGVIALILRHGAQDFHTTQQITAALVQQEMIDDHHIFPDAYLKEHRKDVNDTVRNCVLNRTLIGKDTNQRIGKKAPSIYLTEIDKELHDLPLAAILRSHLLTESHAGPLWTDRFDDFLDEREKLIESELQLVTSY